MVWLTTAYAWAFLTLFVWWLARGVPIERSNWWRSGFTHLFLSVCFALVEEVLFAWITPIFGLPWFPRNFAATFRAVVPIDFHLNVIIYWLIIGVQHSVGYYRRFLERERLAAQLELRATQLESQLTQAKLSALKMQLHPHFLFNTLNAIVVLVRQHRVDEADQMLTNLSELLRQTLAGWETQEVPLRREVELINLYLDIQRVRFQDRLTVETSLSPATLDALVPSLLLQPLVENAVRHGVSKSSVPVRIELKSCLRDSSLQLQVCDNGPGVSGQTSGTEATSKSRMRFRFLTRFDGSRAPRNWHCCARQLHHGRGLLGWRARHRAWKNSAAGGRRSDPRLSQCGLGWRIDLAVGPIRTVQHAVDAL